jgi:hypothetical protein
VYAGLAKVVAQRRAHSAGVCSLLSSHFNSSKKKNKAKHGLIMLAEEH